MKTCPWISAALVAVMLIAGPIMPIVAWAQMQQETQQVPPPPPPPAPDTRLEPSMSDRQPTPMPYSNLPPAVDPITSNEPTDADRVGAGFLNVVYIPGKAIICTAGTVTSVVVMLLTFGSAYRAAAGVFNEGCGGDWVLTPEHVSGKIPGPGDPGYYPGTRRY